MVHFSYNFCSSFIFVHLPSSTQPESVGSILALNHKFFNASKSTCETKGSPLWVFFGTMRLFSKIFEIYQRVPPWIFLKFSVCRKRWMSLNGLFLSFSALCDLKNTFFRKKKIKIFFLKKKFFPNFSNSCSLNIFEPKIWRRLGTFPSCFLFQPTISLWMVHFSYNICSFVQLIFWEAGDRGFDSRTKPQIFYASKSRCETKGFLSFDFFRFFSELCNFFRKFSDSIKG